MVGNGSDDENWLRWLPAGLCVTLDIRTTFFVPLMTIVIKKCYFGWMRVSTGSVVDLQVHLDFPNMSSIAPPTTDGSHLVAWHGIYMWWDKNRTALPTTQKERAP